MYGRPLEFDRKRGPIEPPSVTDLADHIRTGQVVQLQSLASHTVAGLAATTGTVEREAVGGETTDSCASCAGEEATDGGPESSSGGGY